MSERKIEILRCAQVGCKGREVVSLDDKASSNACGGPYNLIATYSVDDDRVEVLEREVEALRGIEKAVRWWERTIGMPLGAGGEGVRSALAELDKVRDEDEQP